MAGIPLRLDGIEFSKAMTARTGLDLVPATSTGDVVASVRASDVDHPNGFTIQVRTYWRSIEASFEPDNFAGSLIRQMGNAGDDDKARLSTIMDSLVASGLRISMRVNGSHVSDFQSLPRAPWSALELKAVRLADPELGESKLTELAKEVCGACLAPILALLSKDDDVALHQGEMGLPEGAKMRIEVNRYERSAANRAACIAIHGARCKVCEFDFELVYGQLGAGFIEVHHQTMVSRMGAGYTVDPRIDLVPLCSNCHSMVHRIDPPLDVEGLRKALKR